MADIDANLWRTLDPYIDHALEMPELERDTWLDDLACRSPEVAGLLRELLSVRRRPGFERFLSGETAPHVFGLAGDALAGRRVGAYVLESELGSGGMGTVWLACRADGQYEGRAAIKLLQLAWAGSEGQERFRREARLLARLDHPAIARLLDAGIVDSAQPYLVLEYVEGERIDEYCDRLRLDVRARVRIILDVIAAVAHAHRHLVVHRDIKPANILVTRDGAVKLLDFGIGSLLGDETESVLTRLHGQALTPEYAAPEQLRGEPVTTATDVHALGLVLYVLLTGRHPYGGPGRSSAELMRRLAEQDPERPSTVVTSSEAAEKRATTPRELRSALRGDLDTIIAKALKKAADDRYSSAVAFGDDLQRYLRHEPVAARPDSLRYRAGKFVRRHRNAVAASSAAVVALLGLTVFATQQATETARQRDEARVQTQRAEAFNAVVTSLLSQVGPGGRALAPEELLDRAVRHVEARYANEPDFLVDMLIRLSGRYFDLGSTNKEYATLVRAEAVARRSGNPALVLQVQCNTVETELAAGRKAEARARLEEVRRLSPSVSRIPALLRAACLRAEAEVARADDDLPATVRHLESARRVLEADRRTEGNAYAGIINLLAVYNGAAGYPGKAHEYLAIGIATDRRLGLEDSLPGLIRRANLAVAVYELGQVRRALSLYREIVPKQVPARPMGIRYGEILARVGRYDEGLRLIEDALLEVDRGGHELLGIRARVAKATVLAGRGQFDEALQWLDDAARRMRRDEVAYRIRLAGTEQLRAEIALARQRPDEAAQAIGAALERLGYPRSPHNLHIARALLVDARVRLGAGDAQGAIKAAREAVNAFESVTFEPEQSADVGEALLVLARAHHASGDTGNARRNLAPAARALAQGLGEDQPLTREARVLAAELDR